MRSKSWNLGAGALGIMLLVGTCPAQEAKPPPPTVGDKVESAVESLKSAARDAGGAIREQYLKMRTSVHNMGVSSRVYGRLHWDKLLTDAKIDVEVREDGVAVLTGGVSDVKAKTKAVELARDTVGVSQVVDRLTVVPVSPTSEATPAKTL